MEMSGLLDGDQCAAILAAQPCGTLITRLVVPNAPCGTCGGTKFLYSDFGQNAVACPDCRASSQEGK